MKNKKLKVVAGVVAVIAGLVWGLLPVFWGNVCTLANSCGLPLARVGRGYNLLLHSSTLFRNCSESIAAAPVHVAINAVMAAVALYVFLIGGKRFKAGVIVWFLIVAIVAVLSGMFGSCGYVAALGTAIPAFYVPVAVFGIAVGVLKRKGFSAMFGWLGFAAFFFLTMLLPIAYWTLANLPASGLEYFKPEHFNYLAIVEIITAVDALFFGYAVYAFCRMELPLKLGVGGFILALACVAGILGSTVVFMVILELLIVALAGYGVYFVARRDRELDDDGAVAADDVTYVNTVLEQEKMAAIDPNKTTFFHIGEHEEFDDKGNKITKKKNSDDDIKL